MRIRGGSDIGAGIRRALMPPDGQAAMNQMRTSSHLRLCDGVWKKFMLREGLSVRRWVGVWSGGRVWSRSPKTFGLAVAVIMAAVLLTGVCRAAEARPQVRVSQGELAGITQGPVDAFLGISYAAPPVGQNRWRAPQPAAHWRGVRSAAHFGASCYQPPPRHMYETPGLHGLSAYTHEYTELDTPVSENCLFLNIWTPSTKGKRPVLVWIHGGGFIAGSGSVPIYDGAKLAAQGIVVVTLNYRLGVFGFLAYPPLTKEAEKSGEPPGNYGLQDMIAALKWLHRNVASFGGDPDAITIAGQSAGSAAVHYFILSPVGRWPLPRRYCGKRSPNRYAPSVPCAGREGGHGLCALQRREVARRSSGTTG